MSTQPHHVQPPHFAPSGSTRDNDTNGEPPAWLMEGGDPLDVDMLADYLLDDGQPAPSGMSFEFNNNNRNNHHNNNHNNHHHNNHNNNHNHHHNHNSTQVVSPEQSEDGGFPPMAEAGNNMNHQYNHAQHQPQQQPQMQSQQRSQQMQHQMPPPQQHQQYPGMSAPPNMTHPGTVRMAPAPAGYAAPAPLAPAPPSGAVHAQNMVVHNHGSVPNGQHLQASSAPAPGNLMPVPSSVPTSSIVPNNGQQQPMASAPQSAPMPAESAAAGGRGRKKSQAQIDRRRERNRILARRTRLRKKFFFESLQKEVMDLQRQNSALKDLVKSKFDPGESKKVLDTCNAAEKLPEAVVEACGEHAAEMDQQDFNLVRSVQQSQHSFIITDPCLQDNPIVFASDGFLKITGYARESVLGRNCRFLQGPETSKEKLASIRGALQSAEDVTVTLVNYMADGTPFWNKLFIAALRDSSNHVVNFIGVVVKVVSPPEDDPEYGKVLNENDKMNMSAVNGGAPPANGP